VAEQSQTPASLEELFGTVRAAMRGATVSEFARRCRTSNSVVSALRNGTWTVGPDESERARRARIRSLIQVALGCESSPQRFLELAGLWGSDEHYCRAQVTLSESQEAPRAGRRQERILVALASSCGPLRGSRQEAAGSFLASLLRAAGEHAFPGAELEIRHGEAPVDSPEATLSISGLVPAHRAQESVVLPGWGLELGAASLGWQDDPPRLSWRDLLVPKSRAGLRFAVSESSPEHAFLRGAGCGDEAFHFIDSDSGSPASTLRQSELEGSVLVAPAGRLKALLRSLGDDVRTRPVPRDGAPWFPAALEVQSSHKVPEAAERLQDSLSQLMAGASLLLAGLYAGAVVRCPDAAVLDEGQPATGPRLVKLPPEPSAEFLEQLRALLLPEGEDLADAAIARLRGRRPGR